MSITADDQGLPAPDGPAISSEETAVEPPSKKSQKKAAKAARYAEHKAERRAREKERKKLKRAVAQPQPHDEDGEIPKSKRVKLGRGSQTKFGARLVVDLGFDDKMTEKVCPTWIAAVPQLFIFAQRKWYPYPHSLRIHTVRTRRHRVPSNIYFIPLWMAKLSHGSKALVTLGTSGGPASNGGQTHTKNSGNPWMVARPWIVARLSI